MSKQVDYNKYKGTKASKEVTIYLTKKKKFLKGTDGLKLKFKGSDTVKYAKQMYMDLEAPPERNVSGGNLLKGVTWTGRKGIMKDDDILSKHASKKKGRINVVITFKVNGGSDVKDDEKIDNKIMKMNDNNLFSSDTDDDVEYTGSFFSFNHPSCKKNRKLDKTLGVKYPLSKDKDIVTFETHEDNIKMSCKHTVHPNTLYKIMIAVFMEDEYSYKICCPKCSKEWDFDDCANYANLNDDEYDEFECEIMNRESPTKPCPHCKRECERPENLQYFRVACVCKKGDWCYECGDPWKGGGFRVCGNDDCELNDINEILKNCGKEHSIYGVKVPKLRACPKCIAMMEHTEACKHMHCKGCGNMFCFICLKSATLKSDGKVEKWNCIPDCGKTVADIQTIK